MDPVVINHSVHGISWKTCLIMAGTLGTLALFVLAWAYPNFPGDEWAISRLQAHRTNWLDDAVIGLSKLGLVWVFLPAAAVIIGGLLVARQYADGVMVVASLAILGIGVGLKFLVDRPRPGYQILGAVQTGPSFPSGHALLAIIIGGLMVYLVERSVKPQGLRRSIQVGIFLAVVCMGASRVYIGVHWPSDVIGSYMFGLMAFVGLIGLRNRLGSDC